MQEERAQFIELGVHGMHCASCAQNVEKQLRKLGLEDASVDLASETASFTLHQAELLPRIEQAILKLGYQVTREGSTAEPHHALGSLKGKVLFSLIWTIPLFAHMFVDLSWLHNPWVQLFLCLPVFALGLKHFGASAVSSLRNGYANMDVLITLSISAAFIYSLAGTLLGLGSDFLFYETSATITTIVLIGNWLEEISVRRTTSAIEEMSKIKPSKALKLMPQIGKEQAVEVLSDSLEPEDRVLVNSGDRIPVDGVIYWGQASIDQSMITGESLPVERATEEQVVGGTVVVAGSIKVRATAVGQDTVLAGMIRLVKQAQSRKPSIQRLSDKVSAVFVPVSVGIAILTLVVSLGVLDVSFQDALLRSIAVLVIACPCAMGLATPTAVIVGIGQAARHGILIKGGDTLERLAQAKLAIFDKTGTLTSGKFTVQQLALLERSEPFVKSVIHELARHSSHPISRSVAAWASDIKPHTLEHISEQRGIGVAGRDSEGSRFELISSARSAYATEYDLVLRENGQIIAALALRDELKTSAASAVELLQKQGIEPVLLSGDRREKCEQVAQTLKIDRVYAERLPDQKLDLIETLEREKPALFVGDGINDAPALARATVGVSLSDATQAAVQSSRVVLLGGSLKQLVLAVAVARKTLRVIKQNLFWAFFYNVLAIPLAAAGYLNPMIAAVAMGLSDVIVILNSLRLKTLKIGH